MDNEAPPELTVRPIGFLRSEKRVKFQVLHQPSEVEAERSVIELLPIKGCEQAIKDLAGFSRIWLVWWFHRNTTWRPLVLPPRGPATRRGVFATRSPHRPNPLGLTPVQLIRVERRQLILGPCDLVDGTPILDIKPYIVAYDSFPNERCGWFDDVDAAHRSSPEFTVAQAPLAEMQGEWLQLNWQIDFRPRMVELLTRDPSPHRSRRIKKRRNSLLEIGCGAWRAVFRIEGNVVTVLAIEPAYPARFLNDPGRPGIPDQAAQLAFLERWPEA